MFNIVLVNPAIHTNTGSIGRMCVNANCALHLIRPLGFMIDDKHLRRAGLDYWEKLNLIKHENEHTFLEYCKENNKRIVPISKFGHIRYDEFNYSDNDILLFGRESTGLRESIWENDAANSVYLPMSDDIRSINVSNTAAIVSYEAFRQLCLNKNI